MKAEIEMLCGALLEAIEKKFLLNERRSKGEKGLEERINRVTKNIKDLERRLKILRKK